MPEDSIKPGEERHDPRRIYRCEACGALTLQMPQRGAYLADFAGDCQSPGGPKRARCVYKRLGDSWPGVASDEPMENAE